MRRPRIASDHRRDDRSRAVSQPSAATSTIDRRLIATGQLEMWLVHLYTSWIDGSLGNDSLRRAIGWRIHGVLFAA